MKATQALKQLVTRRAARLTVLSLGLCTLAACVGFAAYIGWRI